MKLKVIRKKNNGDTTIGELYIDGVHQCYTLEDQPMEDIIIRGETRIPAGTYDVKFRTVGGFHSNYLKRFGSNFHHGMLHITNVPDFEYILIHCGNTDKDTAGCLLVGMDLIGGWSLGRSTVAYKMIYPKIANELLRGNSVTITYEDADAKK
jgi:hypothetical protein